MMIFHGHHGSTFKFQLQLRSTSIKHSPFIHWTLPSKTFIHFWTSSLIINMLNSPNIARLRTLPVQENSNSSSADSVSQQMHQSPQSQNPQILPLPVKTPRKTELLVYWKKQIKRYLMGIARRQSTVFLKTLKKDFGLALNLMGNELLVKKGDVIKSANKPFRPRLSPLRTIAPAGRVLGPSYLLLSALPESFQKSDLFFELTVLGASGKILYNAILLRNWQEIQKELSFIQSRATIRLRFVEEKQNLLDRLPSKQTELRELLSSLTDLQGGIQPTGFSRLSSSQISGRMDNENREENDGASDLELDKTLKVFRFLRREILYNTFKKSVHDVPLWTWPYCSVIYNLLLPIVDSTSLPFSEQIKDFLPSLETLLLEFIQQSQTQFQSKGRIRHYPMTLVNAHLCLSCKKRRGYIACQSCSLVEAKTVSLCLQCYQPFHAEIKRETESQKQQSLVDNWQNLSVDVTFFVQNMMQIPSYPFEAKVKKEQQQ